MENKYKVLHLIDSSGMYGPEAVIMTLCKMMLNTEFLPVIGCFSSPRMWTPEIVDVARKQGIEAVVINQSQTLDWWNLKAFIGQHKIDIIHSHGYKGTVLSFLAEGFKGDRIMVTCHLWSRETFRLKVYALMEGIILSRMQQVIAVSETVKADILRFGAGIKNLAVIENGIDLDQWRGPDDFQKHEYKKKLGLSVDSTVLGVFGRLNKQKGHKYLIEAMRNIEAGSKQLEVLFVGDGPLRKELMDLCKEHKLNIKFHFLGFRKDIKELLLITDIFVMPSIDEGLPIALLEAMAMRKAIVGSKVGAIPKLIQSGFNGILVEKANVPDLKNAIEGLLHNSDLRSAFGENAHNTVQEKFSSKRMVEEYIARYRSLISSPKA